MDSETFDIIKLIEKNSITRLSKEYENKLVNKIKNNFTNKDQQIFLTSFYCYLKYDSTKDFVIDFDNVWKWLGFSRKDPAKRVLEKNFTVDIDYKIKTAPPNYGTVFETVNEGETIFHQVAENKNKTETRGRKEEQIMLTVNAFKKFCLKANTKKADEIHDYYINLETVLQETINEQTNELRLQLTNKEEENKTLEEENKKLIKKYVKKEKEIFDKKNVVYLMTTDEAEKKGEYIVGKSTDLTRRKEDYNDNKLHDFKVVYYVSCKGPKIMDCLESLILSKLGKYRCKIGRDVFCIEDDDVSLFTNIFDMCLKIYEDVEDEHIKYPVATKPYSKHENRKEYKKKYREDNIEAIKENEKIFYENNKDILNLLKKIYCEENAEKISERRKKYYEEHKDEIIKVNMEYYYVNRDNILEKRKDYYQDNKEYILEERQKYYKENYQTKIAPKRQELVLCECGMTSRTFYIKKHKKSKMHIKRMQDINDKTVVLKERHNCECGMVISASNLKRHIKSKRHTRLMERNKK